MGALQFSVFPSPGIGFLRLGAMGVVVKDDAAMRGVGVVAPVCVCVRFVFFWCVCVCV